MAFADPLVLADNAAANKNFNRQFSQSGGSNYVESTATPLDNRTIIIKHGNAGNSVAGGSAPKQRRHLIQFIHTKYNSTTGKTEKMTLNVTLTNDPGASLTTANAYDLAQFASNFLASDTNIDKVLRDET